MKNYRQLIKELPSKSVVFAFGRFNPPTIGHELLFKVVKKLAVSHSADHVIYASRSQDKKKNPLSVDRKIHYLNLMFPGTNFVAADENIRTFMEAAKLLNNKYKNLIMVAGSDRVAAYTKLLNNYNGKEYKFDTIQVISAGERDPDSDEASGMSASKMRSIAAKGDYPTFKKGLPSSARDIDGKLLMKEIRQGMGLESIKEHINLVKDDLREQYFQGEIFNVGDLVEANNIQYEIVKRGSNHLLLKEQDGKLVSKWIQDVSVILGNNMNEDLSIKTIKPTDKLKVARIIASFLSVDNVESLSSPEQIINMGLRKVKSKALNAESISILHKMLKLADEVDIHYDVKLVPQKLKESTDSRVTVDPKSGYNAAKDVLRYSDFKKLLKMNKGEVKETAEVLPAKLAKSKPDVDKQNAVNQNDYDVKANSEEPADTRTPETNKPPTAASIAIRDLENKGPLDSEVGSSYGHGDNSQLRRRKVHYQREEVELGEQSFYPLGFDKLSPAEKKRVHDELMDRHSNNNKKAADIIAKLHASIYGKKNEEVEIEEDVYTSEYKIKTYIDPETGETKSHKIRPHRINFAASKADSAPSQKNNGDMVKEAEEHEGEISDHELDKMVDSINDIDDIIDVYTDEELAIIDDEGNEIEKDLKEETLNEVMSRMERVRAKVRFAMSRSKRQRKVKIALKRHSDTATINKRARHLAIILLKKRFTKKTDLSKLSIGEKERVEAFINKKKQLINRLAMRLTSRVRKVENTRLAHHKYTKK